MFAFEVVGIGQGNLLADAVACVGLIIAFFIVVLLGYCIHIVAQITQDRTRGRPLDDRKSLDAFSRPPNDESRCDS